jgi:hypothetical protein
MILISWKCSPRFQRLSADPSAPRGGIGPWERQHMPRSLPMGQAELNGHASDRTACREGDRGHLSPQVLPNANRQPQILLPAWNYLLAHARR